MHSMTRTLVLAALVLATACRSNGTSDADRLDIYVESAYVHWEQGDLDRARGQALKGLEIDRKNRPLNLMMGWILLRRDRRDDLLGAEKVFRRLVEDDGDPRAQQGLAATLERLAVLHDEAAVALESGRLTTEAEDPQQRADELRAQSREHYEEALELYEVVLEDRPDFIKALNGAVRTTASLQRLDESLSYAEQLLETIGRERDYWTSILQREDINTDEERDLHERVRGATQLMLDTHLFAASALHDLGRPGDALAHIESSIALDPALPEAYSLRAQAFHGTGRVTEAVADLDRFIGLSGKNFDHPDIRRAMDLRTGWTRELARVGTP